MAIPANHQAAFLDQEARGTIEARHLEIIQELRSRGEFPAEAVKIPTPDLPDVTLETTGDLEAELLA